MVINKLERKKIKGKQKVIQKQKGEKKKRVLSKLTNKPREIALGALQNLI